MFLEIKIQELHKEILLGRNQNMLVFADPKSYIKYFSSQDRASYVDLDKR